MRGNIIGSNPSQTAGFGNGGNGIHIDNSEDNTIGGFGTEEGNFIAANAQDGIFVDGRLGGADGNQILNNWIGGMPDIAGNGRGVEVLADFNQILGNIIVSNVGRGISIGGDANTIGGNFIGKAGPAAMGNGAEGIVVEGNHNYIGPLSNPAGQGAGTEGVAFPNVIWNNAGAGVVISDGFGNTISRNSMGDNGDGGIDLLPQGPTPNDNKDVDTGANNRQNFPVLTEATFGPAVHNGAVIQGGGSIVKGSLNSNPNVTFELEFFASNSCNVGALPRTGEDYVDSAQVTTNASGDVAFSIQLTVVLDEGQYLTATATHDDGSTSEFSGCIETTAPATTPTPSPGPSVSATPSATPAEDVFGDADCDGDVDTDDFMAAMTEVAGLPPGAPCSDRVGCEDPVDTRDALDILKFVAAPADFPFALC